MYSSKLHQLVDMALAQLKIYDIEWVLNEATLTIICYYYLHDILKILELTANISGMGKVF